MMTNRAWGQSVGICLAMFLALNPSAMAQESSTPPPPRPQDDAALNDPSVDEVAKELADRQAQPAALEPANDQPPELTDLAGHDFRIHPSSTLREGTFISKRVGAVLQARTREWVVVFHPDEEGNKLPPMVLSPAAGLERIEDLAADHEETPSFVFTGQVFAYQGKNYLLLTTPPGLAGDQHEAGNAAARDDLTSDPTVEQLLTDLEQRRVAASAPMAGGSGDADEKKAIPEGTFITRKRGRIVRLSAGEWAFTADSDVDSPASNDQPMLLAPCLALGRIEQMVMEYGDDLAFEVSGRVTAYHDRNYLVPTMYQVLPVTDELNPMQ